MLCLIQYFWLGFTIIINFPVLFVLCRFCSSRKMHYSSWVKRRKSILSVHPTYSFRDGRVVISDANNLAAFFFSVLRTRCSLIIKPSIDRFVLKLEHRIRRILRRKHLTAIHVSSKKRYYLVIMFNFSYFGIAIHCLTLRSRTCTRRADPRSHKLLTILRQIWHLPPCLASR